MNQTGWNPPISQFIQVKILLLKMVAGWNSTGFTSSTFPIQLDFSQNQPATITLNTGSPRTLVPLLPPPQMQGKKQKRKIGKCIQRQIVTRANSVTFLIEYNFQSERPLGDVDRHNPTWEYLHSICALRLSPLIYHHSMLFWIYIIKIKNKTWFRFTIIDT
jgi:hypothetical protein